MHQMKIDQRTLEIARKQFCLDTCLDWQQYLAAPGQTCYIQKTVYAPGESSGGRYSAFAGARNYWETDVFFKAILCMGQLFLTADEQIYDWAVEQFGSCQPEWFCEYGNLRLIDEKLRKYGRKIADTHIYFLPEEEAEQEEAAPVLPLEWYETEEILKWKENNRFKRAICFSPTQPDRLAVAAMKKQGSPGEQENMAGMAGASEDGAYLWQIGIDVIPEYAGRGLGADLVSRLKREILRRGKIPFYGTSESHTVSQTVALKAGFVPAWTEIYVGALD